MPLNLLFILLEVYGLFCFVYRARFELVQNLERTILRCILRTSAERLDLVESDTIGSMFGVAVSVDADVLWQHVADDLGERIELIVVRIEADIEQLTADLLAGGLEHEDPGARGVADMHHRAQLRTVAHQGRHPRLPCPIGHAVDREVEMHTRAVAVNHDLT